MNAKKAPHLALVQTKKRATREDKWRAYQSAPVAKLPFVHTPADSSHQGRDFWRVVSTGDFTQDYHLGEVFARELVAFMRQHEADTVYSTLREIIPAMIRKGYPASGHDGIVLGFCDAISAPLKGRAGP